MSSLADKIAQVANAIYQETSRGQVNHIIAPKGVVDQLLPFHHYEIGEYQISVSKKSLEVKYVYKDGMSLAMELDLEDTGLRIEPSEITEEMLIGSFAGDYKIVATGIIRDDGMVYHLLHHYVKKYMPEMYEKYKLLDKEDFKIE